MKTKNEKILLAVLIAIVFLGGNYFGYRWLSQRQSSLQLEEAQLRADQAEAKVDLQETALWAKRMTWVRANEPVVGADEGEAHAAVLEFVKKGASDNKLQVLEQSLNDVQHGATGTRMSVSITVKGSMQDLCKWLVSFQNPAQFYALSSFSLKADQDQKSMVCVLHVARYFKN